MVGQFFFRCKGEARIIGRQGMANGPCCAKLPALARFTGQRQPSGFYINRFCQSFYQFGLLVGRSFSGKQRFFVRSKFSVNQDITVFNPR